MIVTPHLGGTTHESMRASALEVAEEVTAVLRGAQPRHCLNEEVLTARPTDAAIAAVNGPTPGRAMTPSCSTATAP